MAVFRKIVEYTSDKKESRSLNPTGVYYVEFKRRDVICGVAADGRKVAEVTHEKTFNWLMDRQRAGLFVVATDIEMRIQARDIISAFQEPDTEDAFVEYIESLGFKRDTGVLVGTGLIEAAEAYENPVDPEEMSATEAFSARIKKSKVRDVAEVLGGMELNEATQPLLEAALEADPRKGVQEALQAKLNS